MKTILFQGDSITDARRSYQDDNDLGRGYAHLVTASLGCDRPGEFMFYNRGVSGNRIVDVYARIKKDILNLKPDYMSLLIGVNDVWHEIDYQNGVDADKFERIYEMLLDEIFAALPDIRIMLLEPYVLSGTETQSRDDMPERFETFSREVRLRADCARRIAERRGLVFVPLQERLDKESKTTGSAYWLLDGVHPTPMGHELVARAWREGFKELENK